MVIVIDSLLLSLTLSFSLSLSQQEQYVFVHKAVIEYLDTFSDYQNFKWFIVRLNYHVAPSLMNINNFFIISCIVPVLFVEAKPLCLD